MNEIWSKISETYDKHFQIAFSSLKQLVKLVENPFTVLIIFGRIAI